jgi:hypothetical protein
VPSPREPEPDAAQTHVEKTLDELAQDMHTRSEGLTHLMAQAEMELAGLGLNFTPRSTSSWLRSPRPCRQHRLRIAAGVAAYAAFHVGP